VRHPVPPHASPDRGRAAPSRFVFWLVEAKVGVSGSRVTGGGVSACRPHRDSARRRWSRMASDPAQRGIPSPPNSEVRVGRAPHPPPPPPRPEDEHASSARSAHKGAGTTAPSGDPGLVATCPLPSDEWQDPLSAEGQCAPHHRKNNTSARRIAELIAWTWLGCVRPGDTHPLGGAAACRTPSFPHSRPPATRRDGVVVRCGRSRCRAAVRGCPSPRRGGSALPALRRRPRGGSGLSPGRR
jgi:hypothetical protein